MPPFASGRSVTRIPRPLAISGTSATGNQPLAISRNASHWHWHSESVETNFDGLGPKLRVHKSNELAALWRQCGPPPRHQSRARDHCLTVHLITSAKLQLAGQTGHCPPSQCDTAYPDRIDQNIHPLPPSLAVSSLTVSLSHIYLREVYLSMGERRYCQAYAAAISNPSKCKHRNVCSSVNVRVDLREGGRRMPLAIQRQARTPALFRAQRRNIEPNREVGQGPAPGSLAQAEPARRDCLGLRGIRVLSVDVIHRDPRLAERRRVGPRAELGFIGAATVSVSDQRKP